MQPMRDRRLGPARAAQALGLKLEHSQRFGLIWAVFILPVIVKDRFGAPHALTMLSDSA